MLLLLLRPLLLLVWQDLLLVVAEGQAWVSVSCTATRIVRARHVLPLPALLLRLIPALLLHWLLLLLPITILMTKVTMVLLLLPILWIQSDVHTRPLRSQQR